MATIYSMTGFGAAIEEREGLRIRVEIRAVNHRGLKLGVRSRPSLGTFEKQLRDLLSSRLQRGAVDAYVSVERPVDAEHPPVREDLARGVVAAMRQLGTQLEISDELAARDLLAVPGLFDSGMSEPLAEGEWPVLEAAAQTALAQVCGMRETEGAATAQRLRELVEPVATFAQEARRLAPQVLARQRERLQNRIRELCPDGVKPADEQALERELCLAADRADINEELDRLTSHVQQFGAMLDRGGEVGKRLEFLAQEFLRELNTSASKAGDTEIIRCAVEAKVAVEKIKEQAANLE